MGQSLVKNYIHIVFSTKYRRPLIDESIENELFKYLGGTCNSLDCPVLIVGGYYDHIHILCMLSKNISLVELVKKVKANSSKWIKTQGENYSNFYWQDGYGAFSVNPAQIDIVKNYIANQKQHHGKKNYKNEFRLFMKKYEVEYDEKYVWD